MKFDFDQITDRRGTGCLKYDFAEERGRKADLLPMWVADMDFPSAPAVSRRLHQIADHGIFGYSDAKEPYFQALSGWYRRRFSWKLKEEWLIRTPGVVFALAAAVRAYTQPGDGVLLQQPVYYPFSEVIQDNDRIVVNSPLRQKNGRYEMDFEDLEEKIREHHIKLFFLCSPHNPVGRVWEEWELRKVGELCLRYGVTVVSDEIHSDFTWGDHRHHVFASLSEELAAITVTCTSPSKTFNLAGLQISNILIPNEELRRKFRKAVNAAGYSQANLMGLAACQAAYEEGEEWFDQLKEYLAGNIVYAKEYLMKELPQIRLTEPEGTYLLWLDFRALGLTEDQREELLTEKAGLCLDSGAMFGPDGEGFERVNIACPRAVLSQALCQLKRAIKDDITNKK